LPSGRYRQADAGSGEAGRLMLSPALALACALAGFLLAMGLGALIWIDGERAAKRERIERARRRDHAKVPAICWSNQ